MVLSFLTLAPAPAAVLYAVLFVYVRRRATISAGLREFEALLALLVVSSTVSVAWHSTVFEPHINAVLLRVLTWSDLSIAPTLLAFVCTRYPTAWNRTARAAAGVIGGVIAVVAASGVLSRAILAPSGTTAILDVVAAYATVGLALSTYVAASLYVVTALRREHDPFERNRLKFVWIATLLITCGLLTNLVPELQRYPLDRCVEAIAALVIFYSLIRYRLFDIDLALNRAFVSLGSVAIVAPAYLFFVMHVIDPVLTQLTFALDMIALVPAVFAAHLVRSMVQRAANRLLLGDYVRTDLAAADFIARSQRSRSTQEIAELIASMCQHHFEARFTAVLLLDTASNRLKTVAIAGPSAPTYPRISIDLGSLILKRLLTSSEPVAPRRFAAISGELSAADHTELVTLQDCIIQPIASHGEPIGLIVVGAHVYDEAYSLNDLNVLSAISIQAALAIDSARLFEQVKTHADSDYLTALPNHRHLKDLLAQTLAEAESTGHSFSVAMIDVDNFKLLNDTHGHVAGDDALRKIAAYLRNSIRRSDIVGRYGGDEFLLILPGLDHGAATELLARLSRNARGVSLLTDEDARRIPMRLSWGVAAYPANALTARALVSAADSDLLRRRYMRRRSGRAHTNRPSLRRMRDTDPRRVRIASGLLEVLDAKDNYTTEHSQQVAALTLLLAEELRLSQAEREELWLGGLLHDVGKLLVSDDVVRKPSALSPPDWSEIHEHPITGARIIVGLFGEGTLADIVRSHHESFDGTGYPQGLAGDAIPMLARAVSVCDAYSAMVHDRPYRKGLPSSAAIAELRRDAGRQWDPAMVDAFVRAMRSHDPEPTDRAVIALA